jgi:hypothetical protein
MPSIQLHMLLTRIYLTLLGMILLVSARSAMADDFQLTTEPQPPWNTTEPVVLRLTIHNESNETRRYAVDFSGFDRSAGLVDRLDVVDELAMGPFEGICADIGPSLDDLTFCLSTQPIPAGQSRSFQFDVVAFPNALGFDEGKFEIRTLRSDFSGAGVPIGHSPSTWFAYGYAPHTALPSLNQISIIALAVLLAIIATLQLHPLRES